MNLAELTGYEAEHLPKAVIAWKEITLPELEEADEC